MSLIEEALRKQREEVERVSLPTPTPPPPPLPDTSEPQEQTEAQPDSSRRPWILLAALIGGGLIAVILIVIMLVWGLSFWRSKPAPAVAVPAAVSPATNKTAAAVVPPPAAPQPPPAPASNIVVTPPPAVTKAPPSAPPPPPEPAKPAPQNVPVEKEAALTPAPSVPAPPLSASTTTVTKIALPTPWPRLTVTGIIGSSKTGRSAAIINGQMLGPGDSIEGVKIGSVEKQKIKLIFNGEERFLGVGGTTE